MKKAMLSQPMAGKTDEEIVATRKKAIIALKEKGYELLTRYSPMSGIAKSRCRSVESFRFLFASLRSLWRI